MTAARRHLFAALLLGAGTITTTACDQLLTKRSPGEKLYRNLCAECHGLDGRGNTPRYMGNPAADLTDDSWRHASSDPRAIEEVIRSGIFTKMPANRDLNDEQLRQIADWVLTLRGERR